MLQPIMHQEFWYSDHVWVKWEPVLQMFETYILVYANFPVIFKIQDKSIFQ